MTSVVDPFALTARLQAGGAALFPTDTLVALAALPDYAGQIWQLKLRPPDKPLILMGADLAQLQQVAGVQWPAAALELAQTHWPGGLTLVLPAPATQRCCHLGCGCRPAPWPRTCCG